MTDITWHDSELTVNFGNSPNLGFCLILDSLNEVKRWRTKEVRLEGDSTRRYLGILSFASTSDN